MTFLLLKEQEEEQQEVRNTLVVKGKVERKGKGLSYLEGLRKCRWLGSQRVHSSNNQLINQVLTCTNFNLTAKKKEKKEKEEKEKEKKEKKETRRCERKKRH